MTETSQGSKPTPRVVFIVGKGRSGSTLLDTLLGQVDGMFSAGELMRVWEWGLVEGYACGCGLPLPDCPVWKAIIADMTRRLAERGIPFDAAETAARRRRVVRWSNAARLLTARSGRLRWPDLRAHASVMADLYTSIAGEGGGVVVDSSKLPIEPAILGLVPGVEVVAVHLVRDPRAVVHSWKRRRRWTDRPGDQEMERYSLLFSVTSWVVRNLISELVARRHRRRMLLTYESLADDPSRAIGDIARLAGVEDPDLGFLVPGAEEYRPTHTAGGNPGRMDTAARRIAVDDEWIEMLSGFQWAATTLTTLPLLVRYGYPLTRAAARRRREVRIAATAS